MSIPIHEKEHADLRLPAWLFFFTAHHRQYAPITGTFPVPVADFVRDGKCPQNDSESHSEGISLCGKKGV
jgi:hypothetical protein